MPGLGVVNNPKGNPNIASAPKTGPKTDEGKLRNLLGRDINLTRETALLKRIRVCNKCPLGEKLITMKVGDKTIQRTKPAECGFYKKDMTECVVPVTEWVSKVKTFIKISEKQNTMDLQRAVILEALKNATTTGEIETIKKGHPAFYAHAWTEMGLKYLTEYNKILAGQASNRSQHLHLHQEKGDLMERILNKMFNKEEEKEE